MRMHVSDIWHLNMAKMEIKRVQKEEGRTADTLKKNRDKLAQKTFTAEWRKVDEWMDDWI